jgi:GDP/UDP-N,N'-diacetylbacillosamine 2-epimerase (hydrolysing)
MGLTGIKFSSIWAKENYDLIIVLGDRYEMFAAIAASIPFGIPVAHLYGGDTTLGAFDDIFRHSLTLMSKLHFVSTPSSAKRVEQILGTNEGVHHVGVIPLDNLSEQKILSIEEFKDVWSIDLGKPTGLVTFHPETVAVEKNMEYVKELCKAMNRIDKQFVVTMPNNDTMGTDIRAELLKCANENPEKFKIIESFGAVGYYSCMTHCDFLLGNTSSGIAEAASFGKYVINIGDRQKGRATGENVFHVPAIEDEMVEMVNKILSLPKYSGGNIYHKGNTVDKIIEVIKDFETVQSRNPH